MLVSEQPQQDFWNVGKHVSLVEMDLILTCFISCVVSVSGKIASSDLHVLLEHVVAVVDFDKEFRRFRKRNFLSLSVKSVCDMNAGFTTSYAKEGNTAPVKIYHSNRQKFHVTLIILSKHGASNNAQKKVFVGSREVREYFEFRADEAAEERTDSLVAILFKNQIVDVALHESNRQIQFHGTLPSE